MAKPPFRSTLSNYFMDAIHFKVRHEGRIQSKVAYVVLGVTIDGYKDVLGIWIGEN